MFLKEFLCEDVLLFLKITIARVYFLKYHITLPEKSQCIIVQYSDNIKIFVL